MNLFSLKNQVWLDLVFENRNIAYGAYALRRDNDKTTFFSLIIGSSLLIILALLTLQFQSNNVQKLNINDATSLPTMIYIDNTIIEDKVIIEETVEIKQTPASIIKTVEFNQLEIVKASSALKDIATIDDFVEANIGSETIEANPDGGIVINSNVGHVVDGSYVVDDSSTKVFISVEKQAIPNGGLSSFYKSFSARFNTSTIESSASQIKVILQFIVESDGSFSNISVLRDPGYGVGKEAIRVLKSMPKWIAAEQNGKKVRSQFTLPITINVQ
jgi:periplasmic protein TonB